MAPAAESVTRLEVERVLDVPQKCLSKVKTSSRGSPSTCCRKERVRESEAGPMPSETMNTRLRLRLVCNLLSELAPFVVGRESIPGFVALPCWMMTASTMTAAVARRAQTKMAVSRRRKDRRC